NATTFSRIDCAMQRRLFRICQTGAILKPAFVYQVASIRRINGPGGHDPIEHPHFWHESEMAALLECVQRCGRKTLDIADIVRAGDKSHRDEILSQLRM